jgi:hypothetical protein
VWPSHLVKFPVSNLYKKTKGYHQTKTEKNPGYRFGQTPEKRQQEKKKKNIFRRGQDGMKKT